MMATAKAQLGSCNTTGYLRKHPCVRYHVCLWRRASILPNDVVAQETRIGVSVVLS